MANGKHCSTEMHGHTTRRRSTALGLGVALLFVAVPAAGAFAAQPDGYAGTLTATPQTLHAGDYFSVTGCGYDPALGNVLLSFTGGGWGSPLDANGCFTIAGIPALSGDTLAPGTYEVRASQKVRNRWVETGDTTVTVIQ
jgi:hypothetical protein